MRNIFLVMLVIGLAASSANALPPTPVQIQEKFKSGDYRATLLGISQALALKPGSDEGYDRFALLMLKGECLIQLNISDYAAHAFEDARAATNDPQKIAVARANELIALKSPVLKYVPRTGTNREPIDIKAQASRLVAMNALRVDMLFQNRALIDSAKGGENLEPLLKLLPALRGITSLEITTTGDFSAIRPMLVEMGNHARKLINAELNTLRARVEGLNAAASELYGSDDQISPRGLYSRERQELASMTDYVRQIESAGREGRRIAIVLGGAVDAWERIVTDASDLNSRITAVLSRAD